MKRNQELFDKNYQDYLSFVEKFQRFPTKDTDLSSSGINLNQWRANIKFGHYGKENKERLVSFEQEMSITINKASEDRRKAKQVQDFYDNATGERHPWEPSTLEEYLSGNNRYKYFSTSTYISIMKKLDMYDKKCAIIALLNNVDPDRPLSMRAFGHRFGFGDLESKVLSVLQTLTVREQLILIRRYGIDDCIPITLREVGSVFGVGQERIRQIEAKAHRKLRHHSRFKKLILPKVSIITNTNYENHTFIFIEEIPDRYYGYKNRTRRDQKVLGTAQYPIDELDEAIHDSGMGINALDVRSIKTFFEYKSLVPRGTESILELVPTKNDDIVAYTEVIVRIKIDPLLAIEKEKEQKERARKCSAYASANRPRSARDIMFGPITFGMMHGDFDGDDLKLPDILKRYSYPSDSKPF